MSASEAVYVRIIDGHYAFRRNNGQYLFLPVKGYEGQIFHQGHRYSFNYTISGVSGKIINQITDIKDITE